MIGKRFSILEWSQALTLIASPFSPVAIPYHELGDSWVPHHRKPPESAQGLPFAKIAWKGKGRRLNTFKNYIQFKNAL